MLAPLASPTIRQGVPTLRSLWLQKYYCCMDCCTKNASNTKLIHISRPSHLLLPSAQDTEIFSRLAVSYHLRCNLLWKTISGPHFWNSLPHQYTWHNNSLIISLLLSSLFGTHHYAKLFISLLFYAFLPHWYVKSLRQELCTPQQLTAMPRTWQVFNYHLWKNKCP